MMIEPGSDLLKIYNNDPCKSPKAFATIEDILKSQVGVTEEVTIDVFCAAVSTLPDNGLVIRV